MRNRGVLWALSAAALFVCCKSCRHIMKWNELTKGPDMMGRVKEKTVVIYVIGKNSAKTGDSRIIWEILRKACKVVRGRNKNEDV